MVQYLLASQREIVGGASESLARPTISYSNHIDLKTVGCIYMHAEGEMCM